MFVHITNSDKKKQETNSKYIIYLKKQEANSNY